VDGEQSYVLFGLGNVPPIVLFTIHFMKLSKLLPLWNTILSWWPSPAG